MANLKTFTFAYGGWWMTKIIVIRNYEIIKSFKYEDENIEFVAYGSRRH